MIAQGSIYRCKSCQTEIEVLQTPRDGGPLVCCEVEMRPVGDEYEKLYESEAYDVMDWQWNQEAL